MIENKYANITNDYVKRFFSVFFDNHESKIKKNDSTHSQLKYGQLQLKTQSKCRELSREQYTLVLI